MDYDQLASFIQVAKLQSFSRAAEKIYRTQPAISAQVRLLEQECGEKLFDRSGKKVQLTPAGEILLRYADEALYESKRRGCNCVSLSDSVTNLLSAEKQEKEAVSTPLTFKVVQS